MIILVADTMLGYHSEEGWTGLIDVVLAHYGIEAEEKAVVLFVGVIPIALDVLFKYWM
ncbi:Proton extrusion protein pcxA [Monoraphidium neglectum]|uniref:Proton extrusion protein pcxA n=1 Tax=Monoraphidium neglectum TaxID=145388 RepID=A0A0D2LTU6_9CHLO|nr:Proton extrusion protein pcxA [Monoraphidium neglectum]KIY95084.1 Proton extrusion protein pcxA [Monoraphidium neglectum]|eukprot:XP_013894104.1 Proton extrusion protein pcxA [Monoraphidium neglectum]